MTGPVKLAAAPGKVRGFKLFRLRRDGTLGPLFIDRQLVVPVGRWLRAQCKPTKGYAVRPGWHFTSAPHAPHLSEAGRVWCQVEGDRVLRLRRPASQGGEWFLAERLRVLRVMP